MSPRAQKDSTPTETDAPKTATARPRSPRKPAVKSAMTTHKRIPLTDLSTYSGAAFKGSGIGLGMKFDAWKASGSPTSIDITIAASE